MKIVLDGGSLCGKQFGNYIFTKNLINSLANYDSLNKYTIYSFCSKPKDVHLKQNILYKILLPKTGWMRIRVLLEERRQNNDIFLALNQANPSTSARVISFSHGLSFYNNRKFYPDSFTQLLKQVKRMIAHADRIIVSSKRVKEEIELIFNVDKRVTVIPFGIPLDFLEYIPRKRKKFFLFVGMNHPIKNVDILLKTFESFTADKKYKDYELVLAGDIFKNETTKRVINIPNPTRAKLKKLYSEATAYLTVSLYESFNFPVLEALSQNCPVIGTESAIIPELRQYVTVIQSQRNLLDELGKAANARNKKIDLNSLKKDFSWKSYVQQLVKLY